MTETTKSWYYCGGVNVPVFVLVTVFGIGSWVSVNAIFVELPILVHNLPEKSNLPSYLTLIVELANIGPLIFVVANKICPSRINLKFVVYLILLFGTSSTLLLAIFWSSTTEVSGVQHSAALFVLTFLVSLPDCTTAVVFYSFMTVFKPQYLTAFFFGEGMSGLVPSLFGLAQGAGAINCRNTSLTNTTTNTTTFRMEDIFEDPAFHVDVYFYCTFAIMVLSLAAFSLMNLSLCDKEKLSESAIAYKNLEESELEHASRDLLLADENATDGVTEQENNMNTVSETGNRSRKPLPKLQFVFYLIVLAWIDAATNGMLLAVQSFACLPYGTQPYHLSAILMNVANPTACFVALFLSIESAVLISALVVVGSGLAAYIFVLAAMSPGPPLVGEDIGPVLVVAAYAMTTFLVTFAKVNIGALFRQEGTKALMWFGAFTRVGSTVGSLVSFLLINVWKLLISPDPCNVFRGKT
ncbi:hypothetical protein ScPMuIL_018168 [Solemya velum]